MTLAEAGAPKLPGYEFESNLGRGGFADVFLYRQHRPERQVAVKVLRQATQSDADAERFENEINRMSKLSAHPGILTIYEVGLAPDQRPYFTMEYCPNAHFGQIAKDDPLPVAQALEVGIKMAGAIDTAHGAGILHRDIKPANILLTAYGEPALTDFGIAGGRDAGTVAEAEGVTLPFAPAEVVSGRSAGDELADVYSLGATIYALLAGRAPFSSGRQMTQAELIQRIAQGGPPPTGREDVPQELERVLSTSMAADPAHRFPSAAAFGRALQTVEASLHLPQTALRIAPTSRPARRTDDDGEDSTRFRAPARVDPNLSPDTTAHTSPGTRHRPPIQGIPVADATAPRARTTPAASPLSGVEPRISHSPLPVPEALDEPTQHRERDQRPAPTYDAPVDQDHESSRNVLLASVAGAMILLMIVVFVVIRGTGGGDGDSATTTSQPGDATLVIVAPPSAPTDVEVVQGPDGRGATVSWNVADGEAEDTYRVEVTDGSLAGESFDTPTDEYRFAAGTPEERLCVRIYVIRGSAISDASAETCAP